MTTKEIIEKMEDEQCKECGGVGIIPSKIPHMRIGHACFTCSGTGKKAQDGVEGWEKEFDYKFRSVHTNVNGERLYLKERIKDFIHKELADARREVIEKVDQLRRKPAFEPKETALAVIYNEAIDDVLATLREET